jgi:DNA-binding LacI/PurR family transcriptional regulator
VHAREDDKEPPGLQRLLLESLNGALDRAGETARTDAVVRVAGRGEVDAKVRPLLACRDRPTALVAGGPILTPPLLATVAALALDIPAHLSFLSLEESVWEATYRPPLAVVRRDAHEAARVTTLALIGRIERWPTAEPAAEPLPVFEPRGSIAAAPPLTARPRRG